MTWIDKYIWIADRPADKWKHGKLLTISNWREHFFVGFFAGVLGSTIGLAWWIVGLGMFVFALSGDVDVIARWKKEKRWHKVDTIHDLLNKPGFAILCCLIWPYLRTLLEWLDKYL